MLCEKCNQRNAVFHWTKMGPGQPMPLTTQHFCEECLEEFHPKVAAEHKNRKKEFGDKGGGTSAGWTGYKPGSE
jgi:protein-arginine kinase activator protein McsA